MSQNKKSIFKILIVLMALFLAACQEESSDTSKTSGRNLEKIERFTGQESKAIPSVYTTQKALSLTFNGMGDGKTMEKLLDELGKYHIKATFFLPGMRVAEEPQIAKEILARGHEIENNTLNTNKFIKKLIYQMTLFKKKQAVVHVMFAQEQVTCKKMCVLLQLN